jgi:hypothetical protein
VTTYYVRKTGSNGAAGTSAGAAWLTISHALGAIASGDTVYVGAGVYRELLQCSVAATAETKIIGDVDGAKTGDAGEVTVTGYTTNDTTAPASSGPTIDCNNKNRYTFQFMTIIGANTGSTDCFSDYFGGSATNHDLKLLDCVVIGIQSSVLYLTAAAGVPKNFLADRCTFVATNVDGTASDRDMMGLVAASQASPHWDVGVTYQNCRFIGHITHKFFNINSDSANVGGKAGGLKILNCTIEGSCGQSILSIINGNSWSDQYPLLFLNNLVMVRGSTNTLVTAQSQHAGCLVEENNVFLANKLATGNTVFAGLKTFNLNGLSYAKAQLLEWGQAEQRGAIVRPHGTPSTTSPLLGWSSCEAQVGVPTTATDDSSVGTISWTSPNNILVPDSTEASISLTTGQVSHLIEATGMGFSIPSDATITGVQLYICIRADANLTFTTLKLLKAGAVTGTSQHGSVLNVSGSTVGSILGGGGAGITGRVCQGDGQLWGATLSPTDVNNSGFGVGASFTCSSGAGNQVLIDYMRLVVFYTLPQMSYADLLNRPRPAGGNTLAAVGALERHDMGVIDASTTDGAGNQSIKLTGYDDHEFRYPVASGATITITVDSQYDAGYAGTNYPQVLLTGGGQIGVTDQTVTNAGGGSGAWTTLSFSSITPTADGVVTLRFISRSTSASGHAWFAKPQP